ncbi:Mss4p nuclear export [Agyrium rufum]|nr:Mss4p nuclear export [Agyrium rufum]
MSKRKDLEEEAEDPYAEESSSSEEEEQVQTIDFEWFDPQPENDVRGLNILCTQLFDIDAQLFDVKGLVDLILSQPTLGSTVKVDGNESDPCAFLTVLSLQEHKDNVAIKGLVDYLIAQASHNLSLAPITELLKSPSADHVGLILQERLLNVPGEISPPMYNLLIEEIGYAVEDGEPYTFSHYLILSKTCQELVSEFAREAIRPAKKARKLEINDNESSVTETNGKDGKLGSSVDYFHPEDEVFQKHALAYGSFSYQKESEVADTEMRRAFREMGIKPQGHLILIEATNLPAAYQAVSMPGAV